MEYYELDINERTFIIEIKSYSKYVVYYEGVYRNEFGKLFSKIKKLQTYHSIEEMEAGIIGFLEYIEYAEEDEIDDEYRYEQLERSTLDDKGRLDS